MASSRVQFALERTLPDVTSQAYTSVFSPDELRSITHSRTRREGTLHRRGLTEDDVQSYAAYEVQLEHLRRLRQGRGERDGTLGQLEPPLRASTRRAYLARVISIYERGLKRRPEHLSTWRAYMRWASSEGMRVVLGRVMSRALGLHNQVPALWIECAQYESANGEVNKARTLLQRGIAICKLPTSLTGKYADDAAQTRPAKKARLVSGVLSASSASTSRTADVLVSDRELSLLSLWIEYLRFELVFLEKLRRRWEVLGLSVTGKAPNASSQQALPDKSAEDVIKEAEEAGRGGEDQDVDDEDAVAAAVPDGDAGEAPDAPQGPTPASDSALAPILSGAIPLSILKSSLTSLPSTSHILFILSALSLLHSFPFIRSQLNPSPRQALVGEVLALLRGSQTSKRQRDVCATIRASEPLLQLHERQALGLDDVEEHEEEEDANVEELESSEALKELGVLRHPSVPDRLMDEAKTLLVPGSGTIKVDALLFAQHLITSAMRGLVGDSPYADGRPIDLPDVVRQLLTRMREEVEWALGAEEVEDEGKKTLYRAELGLVGKLQEAVGSLAHQDGEVEETDDVGIPPRAAQALQSYLSAIARQRISLARKDGIIDASLESISLRLAVEELKSLGEMASQDPQTIRIKSRKLVDRSDEVLRLLRNIAGPQDAQDVLDLLVSRMDAFALAQEEEGMGDVIDEEWQRTLKHPALVAIAGGIQGKTSDPVELWRAYTASLVGRAAASSSSRRLVEDKLEEAIRKTRTSPLSHRVVLEAYLGLALDEGLTKRLHFVTRHGLPSTALLRSLLSRLESQQDSQADSTLASLFSTILSRPDATPGDALGYAKHLMRIGQSGKALRVVSGKEASSGHRKDEEWMGDVQREWQAWLESEEKRGEAEKEH